MIEDESSLCFICGQERFVIDFELEGFEEHTGINHNSLYYIYFLYYLRLKSKAEYGIVDKYVWECIIKRKKDWIPNETSLSKIKREEAH